MTGTPEFVTVGEALVVLIAEPPARLAAASAFRSTVAGAESNVAVGLARLGRRSAFLGRTGRDALGEMVLRRLRAENVDVSRVRQVPLPTGVIIRDSAACRPVDLAYYRTGSAGASLEPADIPQDIIRACRVVHISGITPLLGSSARAAAEHAARVARTAGREVSFDPNLRPKLATASQAAAAFGDLLSLATIVFASQDEAAVLSGAADPAAAAAWFLERGPRLAVIKRGPEGAYATDGTTAWSCPAHRVPVTDPVGAGDAFAAGFLAVWDETGDCDAALRAAVITAAMALTSPSDTDAGPDRQDLDTMMSGAVDVRR